MEILTSFVQYHLFIGFSHLFIYCDDPEEFARFAPSLSTLDEGVHIFACDDAFWSKRLGTSGMVAHRHDQRVFDDAARCWEWEVQSRQCLCVEDAIDRAVGHRCDWLLHVDADEAFLPQQTHPADFFALLPAECEQVFFANLEAVQPGPDAAGAASRRLDSSPDPASAAFEVHNWLAEVTAFKVNPAHVTSPDGLRAVWARIEAARQATPWGDVAAVAPERRPDGQSTSSYFTAYASGKSAVRLPKLAASMGTSPPASTSALLPKPFDVHKFLVPNGIGGWRAARTLTCTEALDTEAAPVILHYPSCGFSHWLSKYRCLGAFGDRWWGRVPVRIPAHLQSRDVVCGQGSTLAKCLAFYRWRICGNDLGEHALLRAHGLIVHVAFPSRVAAAAAAAPQ